MLTLQLYSGFTNPGDFTGIGINPQLLAYGARFESNYQNANQAFDAAQAGFTFEGQHYVYNNITQWRINSNNYAFEQGQQILLYQLAFGKTNGIFNDGVVTARAGDTVIESLLIRSGKILDAVQATSSGIFNDQPGLLALLQHGGNGGNSNVINLGAGDHITELSGYTGFWFGRQVVAELTIKTHHGVSYGPFGNVHHVTNSKPFTYTAPAGESIAALNGATTRVPAQGDTTVVIAELSVSFEPIPAAALATVYGMRQ
jgi:hypothetical protein